MSIGGVEVERASLYNEVVIRVGWITYSDNVLLLVQKRSLSLSLSLIFYYLMYTKDELKRLCLKEGDIVRIARAGDVIPKVVRASAITNRGILSYFDT